MAKSHYPDQSVSAADISRNFGDWQSRAMSSPVTITHHGRPRLILASAEHFRAAQNDLVDSPPSPEHSQVNAQLRAVLNMMRDGFIAFNSELQITDANPAAELYFGSTKEELIRQNLPDAVPGTSAGILMEFLWRVLRTGEPADFKIKSTIHQGAKIRIQVFPYDGHGVGMIFNNLTMAEEASIQKTRLDATSAALSAEPSVSLARLNVRGGIEYVDETFCQWTGYSVLDLANMPFSDLIAGKDLSCFVEGLSEILRHGGAASKIVTLRTKHSNERLVRLTMSAALHDSISEEVIVCVADVTQIQESRDRDEGRRFDQSSDDPSRGERFQAGQRRL